jgi:hypothetical protein
MAIQLGGDLIRRFASPAQQDHLGMPFPIRRGVMAVRQFAH